MNCPRCFGLMLLESDIHGEYKSCLVCGHVSYPEPVDYTPEKNTGRKAERLIGRPTREERRHAPR